MPVKTIAKTNFRKLELGEAVAYMAQSIAEMSQRIADSQAETDAKIAKSKAEMDVKIAKSKVETDAKIARSDAKIAESQAKTDKAIQKLTESQAETDRAIKDLTVNIGELTADVKEVLSGFGTVGKRFGTLTELVVIPGLRKTINVFGHDFKRAVANKTFRYIDKKGQKQSISEIDLFLSNGSEAMAVEVKATLATGHVNKHIQKLKKMREFDAQTGLENKRLYGAVVGVYINEDARNLALKNGLYVVEIQEEEKKLKTEKPAKRHVW